jgi:hypothetical protein
LVEHDEDDRKEVSTDRTCSIEGVKLYQKQVQGLSLGVWSMLIWRIEFPLISTELYPYDRSPNSNQLFPSTSFSFFHLGIKDGKLLPALLALPPPAPHGDSSPIRPPPRSLLLFMSPSPKHHSHYITGPFCIAHCERTAHPHPHPHLLTTPSRTRSVHVLPLQIPHFPLRLRTLFPCFSYLDCSARFTALHH